LKECGNQDKSRFCLKECGNQDKSSFCLKEWSDMMSTMSTMKESSEVLKDHRYTISAIDKQVDRYTKTTKAIAEYVGRNFGPEMQQLVSLGKEMALQEPIYPSKGDDHATQFGTSSTISMSSPALRTSSRKLECS
jgi:hypothetical protein